MTSVRKFLINGRSKKIIRWPKDAPKWLRLIKLLGNHFYRKNLTQEDLFEIGKLSGMFNCVSNDQMQEILKSYPDCEQDIRKYW